MIQGGDFIVESLINTMELNVAMLRKGVSALDMSEAIRKSRVTFNKKRFGETPFDANEIAALKAALELTPTQVDVIFFGGSLFDESGSIE
jgi:hypothetical protein